MSRILPVTQFAAVASLWLAGLSALQVTCLSIIATLVAALGIVGFWIWQDQRIAAAPEKGPSRHPAHQDPSCGGTGGRILNRRVAIAPVQAVH